MSNENNISPSIIAVCIRFETNAYRISEELLLKAKCLTWIDQEQLMEAGYLELIRKTCHLDWSDVKVSDAAFYLRLGMLTALRNEAAGRALFEVEEAMH